MVASLLFVALCATAADFGLAGAIDGTAVNGSAGGTPLAGAEVVLRASQDGAFVPVATTTTDAQGRFRFAELARDPAVIYLPGVNRAGIHYPGPRVRFTPGQSPAHVKLIAYDTVASPSPLVARRHAIAVEPHQGYLEIAETLVVENPSRHTFVGQALEGATLVTLRLPLPAGVQTVTFDREFHGRNFTLHGEQLTTDLPWPPGSRELQFRYRVPVEQQSSVLSRVLDQPTEQVELRVTAEPGSVACNLPRGTSAAAREVVFVHQGPTLPRGFQIDLRLGRVPLRLETHARWIALAALLVLVGGAMLAGRRAGKQDGPRFVPAPHRPITNGHRGQRRKRPTSSRRTR